MHHRFSISSPSPAFTLIELLIVIAIIAILSVVVILTLNPASLLQQNRDTDRISDMATIQSALNLFTTDQVGSSLGLSSVVYVSIADPTATSTLGDQCQGIGLPSLPLGYTYHCAASSTVRNVNGTGWIPLNLSSISFSSPISQLPIDPVNQSSSRLYYTYTTNGTQYEVTSVMESQKYQLGGSNDVISSDGGTLASVYERGTKLGLEPLDYGDNTLVGLWTLDEGTGTIAYDSSGNNATGSWSGTMAGSNGYYSAGRIGGWAGTFDGSSTYVQTPSKTLSNTFSVSTWVYPNSTSSGQYIRIAESQYQSGFYLGTDQSNIHYHWIVNNNSSPLFGNCIGGTVVDGTWQYVVGVYDGTYGYLYVNGFLVADPVTFTSPGTYAHNIRIGFPNPPNSGGDWNGLIDDVRVYNRALTASQVAAMYNGGK